MNDYSLWQALFLGIIEGVTEFLPISSTGHLIIAGEVIGFTGPFTDLFKVVIQFGAILAICALYFRKLLALVLGLPSDPNARRFAAGIIIAFLPAAIIGFLAHDFIKGVLFSPYVVCVSLVLGGIAILAVEKWRPSPVHDAVEKLPPLTSLQIGFFQCLAMIPGVSRSGATILGGLMLRLDRKTAAEFSFFLAIPTMLGATVLDLWKNHELLNPDDSLLLAAGFLGAFLSALLVVRWLVAFVSRHSFAIFAWYRIAFGLLAAAYFTYTS